MLDHPIDPKEQELSDRFSAGEREGRDAEEEKAFRSYALIRERLATYELPAFDAAQISQKLAQAERPRRQSQQSRFGVPVLVPRLAFAAALLLIFLLYLSGGLQVLRAPLAKPVLSIAFSSGPSSLEPVPASWQRRLQRGDLVSVPEGSHAELHLADGSVLSCAPASVFSVQIESNARKIRLDAGAMKIAAAKVPRAAMTVETPLADIRVVGTVFQVKIIP